VLTPFESVLLALIGVVAGFVNVLAGGGSLLTLPAMVLLGLSGPVANGTNRIALLVQSAFATAGFRARGYSDFKLSVTLALAALPGAILGALAGTHFEGVWFNRVLAMLMLLIMLVTARRRTPPAVNPPVRPRLRLVLAHTAMVVLGFYGGFIQAGLGFVIIALLHRVLGLDLVRVNMHKVFIIGFLTVAALAVFAINGKVNWGAGFVLAAGTGVGGWIGAHVAVRRGEPFIRVALNVVLAAMAIRLLFLS
jgi:uncharacterized membrane protein YfcA